MLVLLSVVMRPLEELKHDGYRYRDSYVLSSLKINQVFHIHAFAREQLSNKGVCACKYQHNQEISFATFYIKYLRPCPALTRAVCTTLDTKGH